MKIGKVVFYCLACAVALLIASFSSCMLGYNAEEFNIKEHCDDPRGTGFVELDHQGYVCERLKADPAT